MLLRVLELDGEIEKVTIGILSHLLVTHGVADTCIRCLFVGFQGRI